MRWPIAVTPSSFSASASSSVRCSGPIAFSSNASAYCPRPSSVSHSRISDKNSFRAQLTWGAAILQPPQRSAVPGQYSRDGPTVCDAGINQCVGRAARRETRDLSPFLVMKIPSVFRVERGRPGSWQRYRVYSLCQSRKGDDSPGGRGASKALSVTDTMQ